MTTQLSSVATLFQDDFANPGRLDGNKWVINKWQAKDNPSFLGKTTIRQDLPNADNGIARLKLETYYTDQYNAAGNIFLGDEAITSDSYTTANGGIAFEGKLRFESTQGGMIAGFFSFQKFNDGDARNPHDEIDVVEILTTNLNKLSTNVFLSATSTDYPASMPMVGKFSDWHTYRAEWTPSMVRWFVDGVLVRTDTEHIPVQPQQLHMNLWACLELGGIQGRQPRPQGRHAELRAVDGSERAQVHLRRLAGQGLPALDQDGDRRSRHDRRHPER